MLVNRCSMRGQIKNHEGGLRSATGGVNKGAAVSDLACLTPLLTTPSVALSNFVNRSDLTHKPGRLRTHIINSVAARFVDRTGSRRISFKEWPLRCEKANPQPRSFSQVCATPGEKIGGPFRPTCCARLVDSGLSLVQIGPDLAEPRRV